MRGRRVVGILTGAVVLSVATGALSQPELSNLPPRLGPSHGAEYFVDGNKGSDANPGTKRRPWRTIARAWRTVPIKGSIINVRAGSYPQQTVLRGRGAGVSSPITLRAFRNETVVLSGSGDGAAVYIEDVSGLRVQGFRITNPRSDGIKVVNSSDVELTRNMIVGNGNQGILVVGDGTGRKTHSRNVQIWSNRIFANGLLGDSTYNHGVYYGATGAGPSDARHGTLGGVIANNLFYDQPTGFHLQIGPQAEALTVTNNTFVSATSVNPQSGSAIVVWGEGGRYSTKDIVVVNNAVAFNAQIGVRGAGPTTKSNVVLANYGFANPRGDFVPGLGSESMFVVGPDNGAGNDPLFLDPATKDFRPRAGSPLIGRAYDSYAPRYDATGFERDGNPDIGALEYFRPEPNRAPG